MIGGDIGNAIGEDIVFEDGSDFPILINASIAASAPIQALFSVYVLIQATIANSVTFARSITKQLAVGLDATTVVLKSIPVRIDAAISLAVPRIELLVGKLIAAGVDLSVIIARQFDVIIQAGIAAFSVIGKAIAKIVAILVRVTSCGTAGNSADSNLNPTPSPTGATLHCDPAPGTVTLNPEPLSPDATLHNPTDPTSFCDP